MQAQVIKAMTSLDKCILVRTSDIIQPVYKMLLTPRLTEPHQALTFPAAIKSSKNFIRSQIWITSFRNLITFPSRVTCPLQIPPNLSGIVNWRETESRPWLWPNDRIILRKETVPVAQARSPPCLLQSPGSVEIADVIPAIAERHGPPPEV